MIVVSWNCQGLGQALTKRTLKDLCYKLRPSIVFLMETKQRTWVLERLRRQLGFFGGEYVEPDGRSGGLAIWWEEGMDIHFFEKTKFFIDGVCREKQQDTWHFTFVHGPSRRAERPSFWREFTRIHRSQVIPWLVLGDLNLLTSSGDCQHAGSSNSFFLLNELMAQGHLVDLGFKGSPYTWTNGREGDANVQRRLDRALANSAWQNLFPSTQVLHELRLGSDHCPLVLSTDAIPKPKGKRFRYEMQWELQDGFTEVIQQGWHKVTSGSSLFQLAKKLQSCKQTLKDWSKQHRSHKSSDVQFLLNELALLQQQPMDANNSRKQREIIQHIDKIWSEDEAYWFQRSRVNWLKFGDRNSSFFHAIASRRRSRNHIVKLKDDMGRWLQQPADIEQHIFHTFQNLYSEHNASNYTDILNLIQPTVTDEMNSKLCATVTMKEVEQATFQLGAFKSPGPDGFPGVFYHRNWNLVRTHIFTAISHFFEHGYMFKELNCTNIVLVPIVKNPEMISQYRPISLCNFSYKIIAKILANRLKGLLDCLISPLQSAFVPGRMIQDNILVAHEAFHSLKLRRNKGCPYMAVKLDIRKAYDSVRWSFLQDVLRAFGFCERWVQWIMQCVTTVSYSLIVNGKSMPLFYPKRGLRQGDPLLPYLYLFVSNVLSRMFNEAERQRYISGFQIKRGCPKISHLLFADDTLVFGKATYQEAAQILEILRQYAVASGQQVNFSKSAIIFSNNTPFCRRTEICAQFAIRSDSSVSKLQGWKRALLSQAGREVLIKAVVLAMPSYAMACFKFPVRICSLINKEIRAFWWGQQEQEKRISWIPWTKMVTSKWHGGLGFKDLECFDLALLARQAWRLINHPNALWAQVLKAIHFPDVDFVNAQEGSNPSWAWKSLLKGRNLLQHGLGWNIGSGESVNVWSDAWVPMLPSFRILSPAPPDKENLKLHVILLCGITLRVGISLLKLLTLLLPLFPWPHSHLLLGLQPFGRAFGS
ncbi:hypothetical protein SLEP1_g14669 [Rubroshorea leprosula]|uniref:Reverse transcriptase domain-containing protein n=1 Tax=Rubroshorea leprosula TaxID=152421 RepID=A0AAV5IUD6_9ROSI|nr:hypothetical protein SLEP1_g14669 [Rubroshorea leprosula]